MNILGKERRGGRNGAPQKKEKRGFGGAESMIVSFLAAAPHHAAGGIRNGIGKPFGASLIDDLVPRKRGPPRKGRISTLRWDETRGRLYCMVSLALARQRLCYIVSVGLPETKTDMEAGSEEEGAQV